MGDSRFNNLRELVANAFTVAIDDSYTAGDVVGGLITIPAHSIGGGGIIRDIYLIDAANQDEPYTIYLFKSKPTVIADNAAFAAGLVAADMAKLLHKIDLLAGHYSDVVHSTATVSWGHIPEVSKDFLAVDGNLYAYLVCGATPNQAAVTDLTFSALAWMN